MAVSKFVRGSSTFPCKVCGRRTRFTGAQSLGNDICPQCYELAGIENDIADGNATDDEYFGTVVEYLREIKEKGGDIGRWADVFDSMVNEVAGK